MKRIILAFDSFKGSIGSIDIARSAERAIYRELPECEILRFPIADGGEGTTDALCCNLETKQVTCRVHNPLMNPLEVSYSITAEGTTAILEMASASGLPLVPNEQRNPLYTTTYGTGEIVLDALKQGYRKFILGIGGSATNDAGIGMLHALGFRFLDESGNELQPIGANLIHINRIDTSKADPALKESSFVIACDVHNPFYGKDGAAHVYARQKGASASEVLALDKGLKHYAEIIKKQTRQDIAHIPGSGAAGGMGGGLLPFLNAKLQSGIDTVLEILNFDEAVQSADLIFTGEGKLDYQTTMGKALGGILSVAKKHNVPVIALGGTVESTGELNRMGFTAVLSIQPSPVSLEESMNCEFVTVNIERIVTQVIRIIKQFDRNNR